MREIKFRGKSITDGRWIYGYLVKIKDKNSEKTFIYEENVGIEHQIIYYLVDPKTVGQYIGSKDANDKEIYEGDIVKLTYEDNLLIEIIEQLGQQKEVIETILWNPARAGFTAGFAFAVDLGNYDGKPKIEVIGNIHDNPELLKEMSNDCRDRQ